MGVPRLEIVTVPAIEPVTVAEIREHGRIDDGVEESLIELYIGAARRTIEQRLRETLITTELRAHFDCFRSVFKLPSGPVQEVTKVGYYDANDADTEFSDTKYQVELVSRPSRVAVKHGITIPTTYDRLLPAYVDYTAGYGDTAGDVPEDRRLLIRWLVQHWFEAREPIVSGTIVAKVPYHLEEVIASVREFRFS